MSRQVKRCRKGHAKDGPRCLICKAQNERRRYWTNPNRERNRKRDEYQSKRGVSSAPMQLRKTHLIGERMSTTATACEHPNATQLDEFPGIFYCTDEDVFFDMDLKIVPNPYESGGSQPGKAAAPATTGANQQSPNAPAAPRPRSQPTKPLPQGMKRAYKRDESLMETVKCSHPGCKNTFPMWPQNIKPEGNYCPELHRPQQRLSQAAMRQKRFRERRKS